MADFDPQRLRSVRRYRNLSQEKLARLARVDKQTLHRLERGRTKSIREHTLAGLAQALGVKAEVLTGAEEFLESPRPSRRRDMESDMRVRISDAARNALALMSLRYNIDQRRILEAAPLLFACAAEASLKQRRDRIEDLEGLLSGLEDKGVQFAHLSSLLTTNVNAPAIVEAERDSIRNLDIFGAAVPLHGGQVGNSDADDSTENPFARYLANLAENCGGPVQFFIWREGDEPTYAVGLKEALDMMGGDGNAAGAVFGGSAALHKMPAHVRSGSAEARAQWANAELDAFVDDVDAPDEFPADRAGQTEG